MKKELIAELLDDVLETFRIEHKLTEKRLINQLKGFIQFKEKHI